MAQVGFNICFEDGTIRYKKIVVPFSTAATGLVEGRVLQIVKGLRIPPRTSLIITCGLRNKDSIGFDEGIVEEIPGIYQSYGVAIARSVVECKNVQEGIAINILNVSEDEVMLPRGTVVAVISPVELIVDQDLIAILEPVVIRQPGAKLIPAEEMEAAVSATVEKSNTLTEEQKRQLKEVLLEYADVFQDRLRECGVAKHVPHRIITGDHPPIALKPYRVPPMQQVLIDKHVERLLQSNAIRPSNSPWRAPVVLVMKKGGEGRFCIDYRKLNSITKKDAYPMPRILDLIDQLGGSKFRSVMDLASGYWQIPVAKEDQEKTAFGTMKGAYEWLGMPMGLVNAPATFQRDMDLVLSGLTWDICLVYIDDIIVYSSTCEDHLQHLRRVLERFRLANMLIKLVKCNFCVEELPYLGHISQKQQVLPNPEKIRIIQHCRQPKNVTEDAHSLDWWDIIDDSFNISLPLLPH